MPGRTLSVSKRCFTSFRRIFSSVAFSQLTTQSRYRLLFTVSHSQRFRSSYSRILRMRASDGCDGCFRKGAIVILVRLPARLASLPRRPPRRRRAARLSGRAPSGGKEVSERAAPSPALSGGSR